MQPDEPDSTPGCQPPNGFPAAKKISGGRGTCNPFPLTRMPRQNRTELAAAIRVGIESGVAVAIDADREQASIAILVI